jgi:epoxyqueuosine reductase
MNYLARADRVTRRRDLNVILSGAQALVLVGVDFSTLRLPESFLSDPARGRIAQYAWNKDYHHVLTSRLEELAAWLKISARAYVDTGAILERDHAWQAGLGFIGKNTMLINPRRGSHFFLGELLTTATFDVYDQPSRETQCGTCARCLAACPTNAFPQPHVLDARLCISYLTIEHKSAIPRELRPKLGNWVFGCDVCQTVCPWNRFAVQTLETEFFPADENRAAPPLAELLQLNEAGFRARFARSPIERLGRARLVRNACVAAGNSQQSVFAPQLIHLLADESPLVRAHAGWALSRLDGAFARAELTRRLLSESDEMARAEWQTLIDQRPDSALHYSQ